MLQEGDQAPEFSLIGSDGKEHSLNDFKGRYLVLYFYPKDDTPGCTTEARCFTGSKDEIRKLGAEVVGVSADGLESHNRFASKYNLKILLLSDTDKRVIKEYGAYGSRGVFGMGTLRKTYIVGKDGKIIKIFGKVHADGHDKEVMGFLKANR